MDDVDTGIEKCTQIGLRRVFKGTYTKTLNQSKVKLRKWAMPTLQSN